MDFPALITSNKNHWIHLKEGPFNSYLKNKTQETNLERTVARNELFDELKTYPHDDLKTQSH